MRLSLITLFVSFPSLALSVSTTPKRSFVPSVISNRQYRVPRSLLDLCINVDANLFADVDELLGLESILGPLDLLSKVHLCLCVKDLDIYLSTNADIRTLVHLLGPTVVGDRIRAIINTSPHAQKCTFPQHAHRTCNTQDPCHWECDDGYVHSGDKCVCAFPFMSCNGVCGLFPKGCSSALPRSLNPRTQSILTLSQAKAFCKRHEAVCGIAGREDALAFECIDTAVTKDSCGGCMTRHPFINPVHEVSGQDCTRIPNIRSVGCFASLCIVTSCQEGWVPNANNTRCIVDLPQAPGQVLKRSDPPSIDVTANAVIDSDVLNKLVAIVDAVLHLGLPPSASDTNDTTTPYGVSLLNDVNMATGNLVTSRTIRAFLQNIDHLLDISSLLKPWLSSCACIDKLGPLGLVKEIDSLLTAIAELRTFCSSHPVVSGPESQSTDTTSSMDIPDHALVIRPSDLLAGLRLNGETDVMIHEPHDTNNLLGVLGLAPDDHQSPTSNIDSHLSDKIATLAHLVITLQNDLAPLPLVGHPTPVDVTLFVSIGQVTKDLLNATTASGVMASLDNLVVLSNAGLRRLENCACIDDLGLQHLYSNSKQILGVASEALIWCHSHPMVPESIGSTGSVPVILGLPGLLNRLSLGSLVSTTTTVDESSGAVGSLVDPHAKPVLDIRFDARNSIDSDLRSCLKTLVNLVAKLHVSTVLPSTPCIEFGGLALIREMADALCSITPSMTIPALLTSVNHILVVESSLEKALQSCSDTETVEDLVEILVQIRKVTTQLGDLCGSSKMAFIHHSIATSSRSVRIATSARPHSTTTPISFSVGPLSTLIPDCSSSAYRPTGTRTLPATQPTSSDDHIIVALNHLLSSLDLGGIKGVVTIGGLEHELNEPVNGLLDFLQIGPHGLRHRRVLHRRSTSDLVLQVEVDALVDLFIALVGECGALNCTSPHGDFLEAGLQQIIKFLSATSWTEFVGGLAQWTTTSAAGLRFLRACGCVTERKLEKAYSYLVTIVDTSLTLQRLCRQKDMKKGGIADGRPVVVGLTRLLKALEIEGRSALVLTGAGGVESSPVVNNLSDNLGIGLAAGRI